MAKLQIPARAALQTRRNCNLLMKGFSRNGKIAITLPFAGKNIDPLAP
jgi:hypothetical protein